jgi:hypothetical protein
MILLFVAGVLKREKEVVVEDKEEEEEEVNVYKYQIEHRSPYLGATYMLLRSSL